MGSSEQAQQNAIEKVVFPARARWQFAGIRLANEAAR
jgi:hypothetical protein